MKNVKYVYIFIYIYISKFYIYINLEFCQKLLGQITKGEYYEKIDIRIYHFIYTYLTKLSNIKTTLDILEGKSEAVSGGRGESRVGKPQPRKGVDGSKSHGTGGLGYLRFLCFGLCERPED